MSLSNNYLIVNNISGVESMQKCEKELEKISNELPMYEQIYNKAKKEYENKRKRKIDLEDFIVLVKEELKEKEKK